MAGFLQGEESEVQKGDVLWGICLLMVISLVIIHYAVYALWTF